MAYIFLCHAPEDQAQAAQVAAELVRGGFQVQAAEAESARIVEQIATAGAVLALWSKAAAAWPAMRAQAGLALARGKLVQASLDGTAPPLAFGRLDCPALGDWSGGAGHGGWTALGARLRALIAPPAATQQQQAQQASAAAPAPGIDPPGSTPAAVVPLLVVTVLLLGAALGYVLFFGMPQLVPSSGTPTATASKAPTPAASDANPVSTAPTSGPQPSVGAPPIPTTDELFGPPSAPQAPPPSARGALLVPGALPIPPGGLYPELVLPTSRTQRLTEDDITGLSPAQLRLARNEIYARRGRSFRDPALHAHFSLYPWYVPRGEGEPLSETEAANVRLLADAERRGGTQ